MVLVVAVQFAVDGVTWPSVANAIGASALSHEAWDNAVKFQSFVEAFFSEFNEVCDRMWRVLFKKFHGHGTVFGGDVSVHVYQLL